MIKKFFYNLFKNQNLKLLKIFISYLIIAFLSGVFVYFWQKSKINTISQVSKITKTETETNFCQKTVDGLYKTINDLESQLHEYMKNEKCDFNKTYKREDACICDGEWLDLSIRFSPAEVGTNYMFVCKENTDLKNMCCDQCNYGALKDPSGYDIGYDKCIKYRNWNMFNETTGKDVEKKILTPECVAYFEKKQTTISDCKNK